MDTRRAEDFAWYDPTYRDSSVAGQRIIRQHYDAMINATENSARLEKAEDRWDEEQLEVEQAVLEEVGVLEANIFRQYGVGRSGSLEDEEENGEAFTNFADVINYAQHEHQGPIMDGLDQADFNAFEMFRSQFAGGGGPAAGGLPQAQATHHADFEFEPRFVFE